MDYKDIKESKPNVWVVQSYEREGRPKFNIMGASEMAILNLLDERSQMIFSLVL